MRNITFLPCILLLVCALEPAAATTRYVDGSVSNSGDGLSWETAFKKIQEGINAAAAGDTVIVAQGTYYENIRVFSKGNTPKNIVLRSTDPLDPSIVASTIIDGSQFGPVVIFSGKEDEMCVLSGFTVRNGKAVDYGGGICGGTWDNPTHATIENNTICGNSCGLGYCYGTIQNNTIAGNSAQLGGGLKNCSGTIRNNVITANSAAYYGGGLYSSGTIWPEPIIENNLIIGNSAALDGGGLYWHSAAIRNNVIVANSAGENGGGLSGCRSTVLNNTICGNSADHRGGGLYDCDAVIQNCIIWANTARAGTQLSGSSVPTYSCVQDWTGGGNGNISEDPRFVDPDGADGDPDTYQDNDYRLSPGSPCVDAGDNMAPDLPDTDIAGMHRIMYGGKSLTVDMGANEYYINEIEVNGEGPMTLTWSSLSGKTYSVYRSNDMLTWELAEPSIASMGDTVTTWADPAAPLLSPEVRRRYYRVRIP